MQEISRENIYQKSKSYLNCIHLLFQVILHCSRMPSLFFLMCVSLSQTSVCCAQQMLLFVSFCQRPVPDFASLMLCQHVIGQSLSPASFLNLGIKTCRTIMQLSCTFLVTNKNEKFLFLCHNPTYNQNKNNFQKGQYQSCYFFYPSTSGALFYL